MESLILSKLKWDLSAVTPQDFLEQILSRLSLDKSHTEVIKKHAQTFVALCATGKNYFFCFILFLFSFVVTRLNEEGSLTSCSLLIWQKSLVCSPGDKTGI